MNAPPLDVWDKLWDIATDVPDGQPPCTIHPDPESPSKVTLIWPDGSKSALYWHEGDWRHNEGLNACPGDVAARDTL